MDANSTIFSHNAYLISEALRRQKGIASADADAITGQMFFVAMTHRLHEASTLKEAAPRRSPPAPS